MSFPSRERAPPAHSNQSTAWNAAPPAAGPRPTPPLGGVGASIAQMYILRACRGNSPCPLCRLWAEDRRRSRRRERETQSGILRQRELRQGLVSHVTAVTGKENAIGRSDLLQFGNGI